MLRSPSVPSAPLPVQCRMPVPAAAEEALAELACRAAALAAASGEAWVARAPRQLLGRLPRPPGRTGRLGRIPVARLLAALRHLHYPH